MCTGKRGLWSLLCSLVISLFLMTPLAFAGEADIKIPDLTQISFMGGSLGGLTILNVGLVICAIGMIFGWWQYIQTKNLPAHQAMLDVSNTIWETCKTYLFQQGKFLAGLWILIAICIVYYFVGLQGNTIGAVLMILFCSIMGILGSYGVAWFGIRINTVANSRAAFASLSGNPLSMVNICLRSGMSVGLLLVSIELFFMILILAYVPKEMSGACFHRVCHRRVPRRERAAHLRRYLHQDRRYRFRPHEDHLPSPGGRSEKPRRHRGLHGRQRGRQRRPHGGRLRDLRRHRRGPDRLPGPGHGHESS